MTNLRPTPKKKTYHRAKLINADGVSALCFAKPRPIDLKRASWTLRDDAVTCRKCLDALKQMDGDEL